MKKYVHLSPVYPTVPVDAPEFVVHPLHVVAVGTLVDTNPPVQALTLPVYPQSGSAMGMPLASIDDHVPAI